MPVRDLMTAVPHVLPPTATLVEAVRLMPSADVGSILVMSDDDLVGIVTDRDLVVRGIATGTAVTSVAEVLSPYPVWIGADEEVRTAATLMREREHAVRRLPVLDRDDVVGMITRRCGPERGPAVNAGPDLLGAIPAGLTAAPPSTGRQWATLSMTVSSNSSATGPFWSAAR
jgi:CBS domain-containing protein